MMINRMHIIILALLVIPVFSSDLYTTLGLSKLSNPSQEQIKAAWREKARTLHPDKTDYDSSKEFLKVKDAYEVLSDPEKRRVYDQTGSTDPPAQNMRYNNGFHFNAGRYQFTFNDFFNMQHEEPILSKTQELNDETLKLTLSREASSVWIIEIYTLHCVPCREIAHVWDAVAKEFEPFVNFARINGYKSNKIVSKLGIRSVPAIYAVLDRGSTWKPMYFRGGLPGAADLKLFVKSQFPDHTHVFDSYQHFQRIVNDNDATEIDAIVFSSSSSPTLLSKHIALKNAPFWRIWRVWIDIPFARDIARDLGVDLAPTVVLLNGNKRFVQSGNRNQIMEFSRQHHLPLIPKLTPDTHDELCIDRKRCIVLFAPKSDILFDKFGHGQVVWLDVAKYSGFATFFAKKLGLEYPFIVAMDRNGNNYAATSVNNEIMGWIRRVENGHVTMSHITAPMFDTAGGVLRGFRSVKGAIMTIFSWIANVLWTIVKLASPLLGLAVVFICFALMMIMN